MFFEITYFEHHTTLLTEIIDVIPSKSDLIRIGASNYKIETITWIKPKQDPTEQIVARLKDKYPKIEIQLRWGS